ncbi:MAG: extracellular solute-binding protein [Candidatus Paceibacterota bacterium]|jgi:multiple sugar transport system substrate-binding protein
MKGNFALIILAIFFVFGIFGILVFSGVIPIGGGGAGDLGTVVLWGTTPTSLISNPIEDFNRANPSMVVVYKEIPADSFNQDLLEALASGKGPDMFLLSDDLALSYANKIMTIPYTSYPLATFKGVFAGAGEVFLTSKGILAFPISIDPLVMYYNRSMFDASGVVFPPATWNDLADIAPILTKKDEANKIIKSAVALGHYSNVTHAKDILAALFLQAGNPIVSEKNGIFSPSLSATVGNYNLPSILKFYTDFADPNNAVYSWNKSFPNSNDAFSKEDLAMYFGFASELQSMVNRNPNENFFVAGIPQIKNANSKATSARVTGIAISSASKNPNAAFTAASLLTSTDFASKFATATMTPPARRDLLAIKPTDAYFPIFYNSALYAKSWFDPSPKDTANIFSEMVNAVISNNINVIQAISDANAKMSLLLIR